MNLKCLLYARYTSSIPINVIIKDTSCKELKGDLDRVYVFLWRCLRRSKPSNPKPAREINSERNMEFGSLCMMIMISAMPFAQLIHILRDMRLDWFKNCSKKSHRSLMRSMRRRITSSHRPRRLPTSYLRNTMIFRRWIKSPRPRCRSRDWRTRLVQESRR
jgi:hypothetical protein